jgi:hypothetical protein
MQPLVPAIMAAALVRSLQAIKQPIRRRIPRVLRAARPLSFPLWRHSALNCVAATKKSPTVRTRVCCPGRRAASISCGHSAPGPKALRLM